MTILGWYVDCDSAYCDDCFGEDETGYYVPPSGKVEPRGWRFLREIRDREGRVTYLKDESWKGFEDWEEPLAIWDTESVSSPIHCEGCETLLSVPMDSDGDSYVMEALSEFLRDGSGRGCILRNWWEEYGEGLEESDLRELLDIVFGKLPESDSFSPRTGKD